MSGISEGYRYRMNGVLNTGDGVLANMEKIANSAATWISYDSFTGKWDVVINRAESVSQTFDDDSIIGSISLNTQSLKEMYNSVEVRFPHSDLNNQQDYIRIAIPAEDRLANEPDNTLTLNYELLNDPVQAMLLGLIELKQARLDKTITFRTDYSVVNLGAGEIIAVTNSLYGWTAKEFRIITIKEVTDDGILASEITALEYNASIYDTTDLYRYIRTNASGIIDIGAIGIPDAPQVTKFENISRPYVLIEAEVPGGLVNGMEYWVSYDVTVGTDENRSYSLIGTTKATTSNVLVQGETVELQVDNLTTGNLLVKVRGINSDVTGPFSDPSGFLEYGATQVPDAIGQDTGILDQSGSSIAGLLGSNALLWLLNQLMSGANTSNTAATIGSLGTLFDLFGNTAANVSGILNGVSNAGKAGNKLMIIANSDSTTVANLAQTTSYVEMYSTTFVPDITGKYKIDCIIDQNSSGAFGADNDIVRAGFELFQSSTSLVLSQSGGEGAYYWTDFAITGTANLTAGVTYTLKFYYWNQTASSPTSVASFDISWNVYSVQIG